ncbi:hypothetical protein LBMAG53_08040 [Planctomycetota bacterium]|nr:hypothetical protein LBMAG53_08040 [Planctomycetota bacterium]
MHSSIPTLLLAASGFGLLASAGDSDSVASLLIKLDGKPDQRRDAIAELWTLGDGALPAMRSALAAAPDSQAVAVAGVLAYVQDRAAFVAMLDCLQKADAKWAPDYLKSILVLAASTGGPAEWGRLHDLTLAAKGDLQKNLLDSLLTLDGDRYGELTGKGKDAFPALQQLVAKELLSDQAASVRWALGKGKAVTPALLAKAIDRALTAKDPGATAVLDQVFIRMKKGEALSTISGQGAAVQDALKTMLQSAIDAYSKDLSRARWAARYADQFQLRIPEAGREQISSAIDTSTKGTWQDVYGKLGWVIAGKPPSLPKGISVDTGKSAQHTWAATTTDDRALQLADGSRIASCFVTDKASKQTILTVSGDQVRRISLYFLDWDRLKRQTTVEIQSPGGATESREVTSYGDGAWLRIPVSGMTTITIRNTGPTENSTVSGIFLD